MFPWSVRLQVACGGMHTVVVDEHGSVYTFGVNDEGALGRERPAAAEADDTSYEKEPGLVQMPEGTPCMVQVRALLHPLRYTQS